MAATLGRLRLMLGNEGFDIIINGVVLSAIVLRIAVDKSLAFQILLVQ